MMQRETKVGSMHAQTGRSDTAPAVSEPDARTVWRAAVAATLAATLAVIVWAEESPDRPSPTIEETVEYINQKLASCPEPQVIQFSPPSKITVEGPLFVYRRSELSTSFGSVSTRLDFPRVPGAVYEEWFDLAELSPVVKTGRAKRELEHLRYLDREGHRQEQTYEVYRETYGGRVHTVYYVFLLCGNSSPCIHNGGWEIPAQWRETHSTGARVDYWTFESGPELGLGSAHKWTLEGVQIGELLVCDSDAVERVGRAMTYLIRESGGQSKADRELF